VVNNQNTNVQTRNAVNVGNSACRIQAEFSLDQHHFVPQGIQYLNMYQGYEKVTVEQLNKRSTLSNQDKQLIGMIELLICTLHHYKKRGEGYPIIYIEEMETSVHPKQQRQMWGVILKIFEDWGEVTPASPVSSPAK